MCVSVCLSQLILPLSGILCQKKNISDLHETLTLKDKKGAFFKSASFARYTSYLGCQLSRPFCFYTFEHVHMARGHMLEGDYKDKEED